MKPAKFPQVVKRRIGKLDLVDLKGDLVGPWAVRVQQEIDSMAENDLASALVLNLRPLETMDSLGAKAVVENLIKRERSGMIRGSEQVMSMIKAYPVKRSMNVINGEEELVKLFGREMAQTDAKTDKRLFRRIKTALPMFFYCKDKKGKMIQFRAIVTNMSEGGLFAEYIDLEDAEKSKAIINPYELSLLKLEIAGPDDMPIEAEGKVIHVKADGDQVGIGIEFYGIAAEAKKKIRQLLTDLDK